MEPTISISDPINNNPEPYGIEGEPETRYTVSYSVSGGITFSADPWDVETDADGKYSADLFLPATVLAGDVLRLKLYKHGTTTEALDESVATIG